MCIFKSAVPTCRYLMDKEIELEKIRQAAALAVGFVWFQKTLSAGTLVAVRTLIYKHKTVI